MITHSLKSVDDGSVNAGLNPCFLIQERVETVTWATFCGVDVMVLSKRGLTIYRDSWKFDDCRRREYRSTTKKRTKVKCQLFRNYNRSQRVLKMVQKGEGKKSGERISD